MGVALAAGAGAYFGVGASTFGTPVCWVPVAAGPRPVSVMPGMAWICAAPGCAASFFGASAPDLPAECATGPGPGVAAAAIIGSIQVVPAATQRLSTAAYKSGATLA